MAATVATASDVSPSFLKEKYYGRQAYGLVSKKSVTNQDDVYVVTAFNNIGDFVFSDLARKNEIIVKNPNPTVSFQFSYPFIASVHQMKGQARELQVYNVEAQKKFSTAEQEKDLKIAVTLASEESLFCVLAGGSLLNIKWQDPKGSTEEISQSFQAAKSKPIRLEGEEVATFEQFDNKLSSIRNNRVLLSDGLSVLVFNTESGELIFRRKLNNYFKMTMIEQNDAFIVAATSEKIYIWNIADETRDYEVSTELAISAMQIYGNTLFAGNVKGLVDIYDLQNHSKGQPFHNTSSLGASKKNFKELMEARVNWIYFVEGFLLVLIKDKLNVWDVSLDERFVPLKSKTLPGKKHRFLMANDGEFYVSCFNADKEQEGGQVDVYNWKPNVRLYKKLAKRVRKSTKYQQITENVVGKDMLKTLTSDMNFMNVLFQASFGSRVDVALVDSMLRVFNTEGRLTDLLDWAVDTEFSGSDSLKQNFKSNWGFIVKDDFPSFELLFYDTRITTQIILRYLNLTCKSHMKKMFGEVIAEVLQYEKELQISSMISNKKRTKEEKESAKNAKKLIAFATKMINGIIDNKNSIPTQMVALLQRIDAKMKATFAFAPEEVAKSKGIGAIMFEKFYCRAIAAPDAAGLTAEPISPAARYNLARLSLLLENVALGKPVAEPASLQEFCKENSVKIGSLIDTIAKKSTFTLGSICLITKHVSQKRITKSLNPDHVMLDKDYFMVGGFVLYMSPKIIDRLNENISQYLPILRKFKQKTDEMPEAQQMCTRCNGDIGDEEAVTDYIQQAIIKAFAPPGTFPEEDDSETESSIESRMSIDSKMSSVSLTSVSSRSLSSANSSIIPNVGFLTKAPENYERLADWLNNEASKHRFLVVVVFRGSWCAFCQRYMQNWGKYFSDILEQGGMLVGISSEDQRKIGKTAKKWGLTYPIIGEPENTIADQFTLNISERHGYVNGMAQPGVLVFSKNGNCVYSWKSNPKLSNGFGALERPKPRDVLKTVFSKLSSEAANSDTSSTSDTDSSDNTSPVDDIEQLVF